MPNRLKESTSPYLLQHAGNPVDWHPWDAESLNLARDTDRPILLSIGYSACHWCHVMERESFESPEVARIMNEHFVCIKVDREERPDLDRIYQIAHQILTRRPGGWPLNVVLTPGGHAPFFAGTYFPPEPRFGMPAFKSVLQQVAEHYTHNRDRLADYHRSFAAALEKINPVPSDSDFPDAGELLLKGINALQGQFDDVHGGFGNAPKFPHPSQLDLLLVGAAEDQEAIARRCSRMVSPTLQRMARGGLFDQLGGGFFRYSVDREWKIPHFEKMLYDNAQLLGTYCHAFALGNTPLLRHTIEQTANWVLAEMQDDAGGYMSTLDADSEDEEGKYYVWSETDLRAILADAHYAELEEHYALFGEPNFEGRWHFNVNPEIDPDTLAEHPDSSRRLHQAKQALLNVRSTRVRPGIDDKILTTWNGLMIKGMTRAARTLNHPGYLDSARRAIRFIRDNSWSGDRFMACCSQGKSSLNGYLDDYAFMLEGLLEMLETEWSATDVVFAVRICDRMLEHFEDPENGGFYFSSHDHETLLCRLKPGADDAIPSGNASAILGLLRLGALVGEPRYLESADRALRLFSDELERQPSVNASMNIALQYAVRGATVIVRATREEQETWRNVLGNRFDPLVNAYFIDSEEVWLPGQLARKKPKAGGTAYLCRGAACSEPADSPEELLEQLSLSRRTDFP